MEEVCRVCMGSESLKELFKEHLPKDEPNLGAMLTECLNTEIKKEKNLSKKICTSCSLDTQIAFRLKQRFAKTNQLVEEKQKDEELLKSLESDDWMNDMYINVKTEQEETNNNLEDENLAAKETSLRKSQRFSKSVIKNALDDNLSNDSSTVKKEIHECETCHKTFISNFQLQQHMKFHKIDCETHKCFLCQKSFFSQWNLERHMNSRCHILLQNGEMPFKCSTCSKGFTTRIDLKAHTNLHTCQRF